MTEHLLLAKLQKALVLRNKYLDVIRRLELCHKLKCQECCICDKHLEEMRQIMQDADLYRYTRDQL